MPCPLHPNGRPDCPTCEAEVYASSHLSDVLRQFLRARRERPIEVAAALAYELAALIALHADTHAQADEVITEFAENMRRQIARIGIGVEHP